MTILDTYYDAMEAYDNACEALYTAAADHVDSHDELDTDGEWRRMREAFGPSHVNHWTASADGEFVEFYKTTARGLREHRVIVKIVDLEG